jgi:branched-chain amino acid transport system permease protein
VLAAATAAADEPERRCRELLPVFVAAPADLRVERRDQGPAQPYGVRLTWRGTAAGDERDGTLLCWFLPRDRAAGAWQIAEVVSSRYGRLSRYDVQQAYKMLRARSYETGAVVGRTKGARLAYLAQQTVNGLSVGAVYALVALAFTIVFALTRAINLAFGPLYTVGAFVLVVTAAALRPSVPTVALLVVAVGSGVATGAAAGWLMERTVFAPTRRAASTVPLVASIGLAVALQDWVRISQGPRTHYVLLAEATTWRVATGTGFDVHVSKGHVAVGTVALGLCILLWRLSQRTALGRRMRACAQDPRMAELLGVDIARMMRIGFGVAGAAVATAGVFAAAQYGVVNFRMGAVVALKGLTAAILGGIGSLPGALLGALVVALTEAWTAAYVGSEWREVAVFGLLVGMLVLRPEGLLGSRDAPPADLRSG